MPDPLIREIPLIQRYSRHNEAEDNSFRAYFKGTLNLSNEKLDAIVHETTDEVWREIDCLQCANCCKTLHIVVDDQDIARLATRLKVSNREFEKKYVRVEEDRTKLFHWPPCPFLGEDNRCTVYEDRPQACRDFPFLHDRNFRSRSLAMLDNLSTCPIVFNVWQRLKVRLKFRKSGVGR